MRRHSKAPSVGGNHVGRIGIAGVGGIALAGSLVMAAGGGVGSSVRYLPGTVLARADGSSPDTLATPDARAAGRVPDVVWLAERGDGAWIHGRGATTAPDALPDGETGLAAGDRWLASTVSAAAGIGSTIRLRDSATAALSGAVDVPIHVSAGAWTTAGLVVTGYGDAAMGSDGGLLLVSVPDLAIRELVAPRPFPAALGTPVARGEVVVSPSGRVAASNICGVHLCDTQVVDLASGDVFHPIQSAEGFLRVVTDDAIVTTDDDYDWISARRFRDGREAWRRTDSMLLDPLAAADGSVVGVVGSAADGWGVAAFDPRGRGRDLTPRTGRDRPWPRIWRQLSTPTTAVVGSEGFEDAVRTRLAEPVTVVPVASAPPPVDMPTLDPSPTDEVTR